MTQEQTQIFKILCIFKKLCNEYQLRYCLIGGTLLGAVRHKGFIPWDDDIDIAMPLEDFLKFQELSNQLPEGVVIQSEKNDLFYPFIFIKLCDTKYSFYTGNANVPKGVYIDIFPMIPSKNLNWKMRFRFNIIHVTNYVIQVKTKWSKYVPYKRLCGKIGFWLLNCFSIAQLRKLREKQIEKIYDVDNRAILCSPGGVYNADKEFYPAEWFSEMTEMAFEGEYFRVPVGWHAYLNRNYGDYMVLPPICERISLHK